jgi:hypothetical protein
VVRGIDLFKKHFELFDNAFVIIGGTASMLLMEDSGLEFRGTKDIDVVLYVEALTREFAEAFWDFVEEGGYENTQQSTGKRLFYRFYKPRNAAYPEMVELFSRKPDAINLREGSHLTPIPIDEEVASLSAILLDDSYYSLAQVGRKTIDGLPVLGAEYLIPFKAKAWLDLSQRRYAGEAVDEKHIRKHRNDVFRLYNIIVLEERVELGSKVAGDLSAFLDEMKDADINLSQLGLRHTTLAELLGNLRAVYGLDSGS